MIDLVAFAVLALAAWLGWRRGTLLMGLSVASLVAGYIGAILLFRPAGHLLARIAGLPPMVALPAAGLFVMLAITTIIKAVTWKVERSRAAARAKGETPNPVDSAGGAAIGALRAGAFVVLGAWLVQSMHGVAHVGPDISSTITGRLAGRVMHRATFAVARRVTGDPLTARVAALMASDPKEGIETVNLVMRDVRVQQLWTDTLLRASLAGGNTDAVAANPAIRSLAGDTAFLAAAGQLGVVPAGTGSDQLAAQLVSNVGPLVRSVQSMRDDPEMKRMLENPDMRRLMEEGNFAAIATDPRFNELAGRVLERLRSGAR